MPGRYRQFRNRPILQTAVLCLLAMIVGCGDSNDPPQVQIGSMVWNVDLATTNEQRACGMAGRAYLSESVGMLFIYPKAKLRAYCMRGCLIPLDIAFIDSDLRIVKIYTMPTESDHAGNVTYSSILPAQYILEVSAGSFARHDLREGAKVTFLGNIPPATKAESGD
ncbi:MAG: DUF192 domain-containing protein [bacterium]|nr:DUF192 domain-containing protein [bacterium]